VSITAIVENDMIKLPPGIHVPDGTPVQVDLAEVCAGQWPVDYFARTAGAIAGERLERPEPGDLPQRNEW
jgi:hypothetical protein